ncbi:MAG: formamidopyrimidine-DNA glycosylase [Polyangiaceae bacterium]|nr:formamidopyrimidine-DNA glycosylase [Polyangiaceae bacterium]MCE7890193.1 formamidopyrimidine-DNA glycosylase [Sorangiineae bacterium PRO1]
MPELPDVLVYVERLAALIGGRVLERARVASPFVVRTFAPPLSELHGARVAGTERIGKRIVLAFEGDLFLVIHLMIAGRLRWRERGAPLPKKLGLLALDFEHGTLLFTEASTKKRASVHVVRGRAALEPFDRGGVEPLAASLPDFAAALRRENRTLKRALTDPRLVSGVGNAYSDEILFHARLSPVRLTRQLDDEELARLLSATRDTLLTWIERTRAEVGDGFPEKVTAFREGMAVHGRYGRPCPVCGTKVQRIRFAENEVNYCPRCQTGGKLLADRGLSRLLKGDWPKSIDELEERLGKAE